MKNILMKLLTVILAAVLGFGLISAGYGEDTGKAQGSFDEDAIAYPRISYTVPGYGVYYIPLSEELARLCKETVKAGSRELVYPTEYLGLFTVELSETEYMTVYSSTEGGYFCSGVRIDTLMPRFLERIRRECVTDPEITLDDFSHLEKIEILNGDTTIFTSDDRETLDELDKLLSEYQGSSSSRFEDYVLEVRCTKADGSTVSLCLAVDEGYLFIPPFRYYKLPQESGLRETGWPELMGLDGWDEDILPYRYQYEDGVLDEMFVRTGLLPRK